MIIMAAIAAVLVSCSTDGGVVVDKNLPAGNIVVERMVNDTVYVHQELRPRSCARPACA